MPSRFPAPPLKVKEPKTLAHTLVTPSYAALPKYGEVFGKHYIPIYQDVAKLNVS
jgi:hypothetical protein